MRKLSLALVLLAALSLAPEAQAGPGAFIEVSGGIYHCLNETNPTVHGYGFTPGDAVTIVQQQQGQADQTYQAIADYSGQFLAPVAFLATGNVRFTAYVSGHQVDSVRIQVIDCPP